MFAGLPKIGVGTFRLRKDHLGHRNALTKGLLSGLRVVDTARTYQEGESEELVGEVLQYLKAQHGLVRSQFKILSKTGYVPPSDIQVHDMPTPHSAISHVHAEAQAGATSMPNLFKPRIESTHEMIDLSHLGLGDFYQSLHPSIIHQQLGHSLEALKTDYLDSYLLHNPEHYLQYQKMLEIEKQDAKPTIIASTGSGGVEAPSSAPPILPKLSSFPPFEEKIFEAFVALEEAVKEGKIRSYGISCNWLAYASESKELGYKEWPDIAESAYNRINPGNQASANDSGRRSSFKVLQFPANLLETYGSEYIAPWAKSVGLSVVTNRPLDAYDSRGQWRLATYKGIPNSQYQTVLAQTLERLQLPPDVDTASADAKNFKFLTTLVKDLDRERFKFESVYHYQQDFSFQIMPMLVERMSMMKDPKALEAIQVFLEVYEAKVREHCSTATEDYISQKFKGKYVNTSLLQHFAMKSLLDNPNIDIVLNGMTRSSYVEHACSELGIVPV